MTTRRDWLFRAEYLRMKAAYLRRQAQVLIDQAQSFDNIAKSAQYFADHPEQTTEDA